MERAPSLVAPAGTPTITADPKLGESNDVETAATTASIGRYIESGQRVRTLVDFGFKLCILLVVLIALAWAAGLLPGAVKLF